MFKKTISITLVLLLLTSTVLAFSDISSEDWFYADVTTMQAVGIVNGKSDGSFAPYDNLTVAEAIKLAVVARVAYYDEEMVEIDPNGTHWVSSYYNYAEDNGLLENVSFSDADFDTPITRGEMFHLFARVLNKPDFNAINSIKSSNYSGITDADIILLYEAGIVVGSDKGFEPDRNITRAEVSAIIHRVVNPFVRQYIETSNSEFEDYQIEALNLLNAARVEAGLNELILDSDLCKAAEQLALEYSQGSKAHKRLDGRHVSTVMNDLGLAKAADGRVRAIGTNYSMGGGDTRSSASDVHNAWMNSDGHRDERMKSNGKYYGIGCVTVNGINYWVEVTSTNGPAEQSADSSNIVEETQQNTEDDYEFSDYQLETLELVNASRAELGLEPLQLDVDLCKAADQLALEYSQGSSAHKRLDGRLTDTVLDDLGLARAANGRRRAMKDNYAKGTVGAASSAVDAHNVWMNSEIHRKEIVSKTHKYIGISKVESNGYIYWVAVYSSN